MLHRVLTHKQNKIWGEKKNAGPGEVVYGFFCVVVMMVLQLILWQMELMSWPSFLSLFLCLRATSSSWVLPGGQ